MPRITKRKYVAENSRLSMNLTRPLNLIVDTLKPGYTAEDLLSRIKKYYPFEWKEITECHLQYQEKDLFLQKVGKKKRYRPLSPEIFFYSLPKVKYLLSTGFRTKHEKKYDENKRRLTEAEFVKKRIVQIEKRKAKIDKNNRHMQRTDPGFLDALIFAYHKKENAASDKLEICKEIQKYDCDKTWRFFWKLNDSERNNEIRHYAFQCLQNSGHYVKLRKNFKGKKKSYMVERSSINGTPEELARKLSDSQSIQNLKSYDLFISHSYNDQEAVLEIVSDANKAGLNCYVDWTADDVFLKRSMVSDFTKEVLKARMRQSKRLLFISSSSSRESAWVDFELEFYRNSVRNEMLMILLDGCDNNDFTVVERQQLVSYLKEHII